MTTIEGVDGVAQGEIIEIIGRILNRHGEPVPVWASRSGKQIPSAGTRIPMAPTPHRWTRTLSVALTFDSDNGDIYWIKTVKPGAYSAGPDSMRPPHIHFEIHGQSG